MIWNSVFLFAWQISHALVFIPSGNYSLVQHKERAIWFQCLVAHVVLEIRLYFSAVLFDQTANSCVGVIFFQNKNNVPASPESLEVLLPQRLI